MTPKDPLLSLDPSLQQAVRSTVLTAKWKHAAHDTRLHDRPLRIHAYPLPRSAGLICWGVMDEDLRECIATGVMP